MRLDLYLGETPRFLHFDICACFDVTNTNNTPYLLTYYKCCPTQLDVTTTIPANSVKRITGGVPQPPDPGITYDQIELPYVPGQTELDGCNECFQYKYKLYNCVNATVIYTDYLECPDCLLYINQFVRTYLEPNPCWFITVTEDPVGTIIPVEINGEGYCEPCEPKCYTITGTGVITYFDVYYELTTADAPAVICSASYPSVTGNNHTITSTGNCDVRNACPIYCYTLTNCVTGEQIKTSNQDLAFPYVLEQTIEIAERDGCWTITRNNIECDGAIETTIINTHATCADCVPAFYYRLQSCGNSEPIILYTSQDLSAYVGQTISLNDYIGCYNVTIYQGQVPNPVTISFKNNYPDCIQCESPRYVLYDCDEIRGAIYTTTDLSAYLNNVIKLTFYPDTCWTVQESIVNSSDDLVIVGDTFSTCAECALTAPCICSTITNNSASTQTFGYLDCDNVYGSIALSPGEQSAQRCVLKWIFPGDWTLPKIVTNCGDCVDGKCVVPQPARSVRPGYSSPACTTEYYERIACEFSEILYRDVISQRYGIAPCCPEEQIMRLDIKFQLLELQAINNPDYLCAPTRDCCSKDDSCGCGCNS